MKTADIEKAESITKKIVRLLRPTGQATRLLQVKNWYYECALEAHQLQIAISGFEGTRQLASPTTRLYLEATALLGIAYLRKGDLSKAEKLVREAYGKVGNIKSEQRRRQFRHRFLERLEEESILGALIAQPYKPLSLEAVHQEAVRLIKTNSTEELLETLGKSLPPAAVVQLTELRKVAVPQLPAAERKLLPAATKELDPQSLGRRTQTALRRVAWRSVCDPESEIFKAWSQGLAVAYDKKYITGSIVAAFQDWKISAVMLAASMTALIMRFSAEVFCETLCS